MAQVAAAATEDGADLMVDVIDYPTNKVKPDCLPEPGDRYEAYGLAHEFKPPTLIFVFPDWSMVSIPYARAGMSRFKPLGEEGDCHGECVITMQFDTGGPGTAVVITGSNLHDFFWHYGDHDLRWLWALPEQFARAEDGRTGDPFHRGQGSRSRHAGRHAIRWLRLILSAAVSRLARVRVDARGIAPAD